MIFPLCHTLNSSGASRKTHFDCETLYRGILDKFKFWKCFSLSPKPRFPFQKPEKYVSYRRPTCTVSWGDRKARTHTKPLVIASAASPLAGRGRRASKRESERVFLRHSALSSATSQRRPHSRSPPAKVLELVFFITSVVFACFRTADRSISAFLLSFTFFSARNSHSFNPADDDDSFILLISLGLVSFRTGIQEETEFRLNFLSRPAICRNLRRDNFKISWNFSRKISWNFIEKFLGIFFKNFLEFPENFSENCKKCKVFSFFTTCRSLADA